VRSEIFDDEDPDDGRHRAAGLSFTWLTRAGSGLVIVWRRR
jgi:hypothetical protein